MNQPAQHPVSLNRFIEESITAKSVSAEAVSEALGCKPSLVHMFLSGSTRIPVSTVSSLAALLHLDPASLLRRLLWEYMPETLAVIENVAGEALLLTHNERELIRSYRSAVSSDDRVAVVSCARDIIAVLMI